MPRAGTPKQPDRTTPRLSTTWPSLTWKARHGLQLFSDRASAGRGWGCERRAQSCKVVLACKSGEQTRRGSLKVCRRRTWETRRRCTTWAASTRRVWVLLAIPPRCPDLAMARHDWTQAARWFAEAASRGFSTEINDAKMPPPRALEASKVNTPALPGSDVHVCCDCMCQVNSSRFRSPPLPSSPLTPSKLDYQAKKHFRRREEVSSLRACTRVAECLKDCFPAPLDW
eukprot:757408-Hanusia_phi.AAC.3